MENQSHTIELFGISDKGSVRADNQDAILLGELGRGQKLASGKPLVASTPLYLVVADGMGGAAGGLLAAETVTNISFRRLCDADSSDASSVSAALMEADKEIKARVQSNPELRGMGAVATACVFQDGRIFGAQVGDTRLYRFRGKSLARLTSDQTRVAELVKQGLLAEQDAENHPEKHVVLQAIGPMENLEPVSFAESTAPDDVYLICSDGLTRHVNDQEIEAELGTARSLESLGRRLLERAISGGGEDNISIVLARIVGDSTG